MPTPVLMPALSPTMTEGKISKWMVKEGDSIESGIVLCEIETDKAVMEFESVDEGVICGIAFSDGTENIAVNSTIAWLLAKGETKKDIPAESNQLKRSENITSSNLTSKKLQSSNSGGDSLATKTIVTTPEDKNRVFSSPLARRMAKEYGIALESISGTGPHGRIIIKDVEKAQNQGIGASQTRSRGNQVAANGIDDAPYIVVKHTTMRQIVAKRLSESKATIPHFYLSRTAIVDNLLFSRSKLNANAKGEFKISINDMIVKATAIALEKFPDANVIWEDSGMRCFQRVDISVAVAIKDGLITPVLRNVASMGLKEISIKMKDLASRARNMKLQPEEYTGGSFTISNLGMFGVDSFQAIINPPQSCILSVGKAVPSLSINNDGKVIQNMVLALNLSIDHRAVDGSVGAQLLGQIVANLEDPINMLV